MTEKQRTEIRRIANEKELNEFLNSTTTVNKLVLVHVELDGVIVTKNIDESLSAMSHDPEYMGQMAFCRLNSDDFYDLLNSEGVHIAPTVLFYHRTKMIDRVEGFNRIELLRKVKIHLNTIGFVQTTDWKNLNSFSHNDQKFKHLIHSSPVILFMKGTPASPQCGFSRQACHLLDENQIKYDYFDVLADQNVRELLKKYSSCHTFPQLFVDGEFLSDLETMSQKMENEDFRNKLREVKTNKYLESLTRQAPLMIFIKGTPSAPRCGFTKELLALLAKANVSEFETFDILSDEFVREKLKEYSSWQTYPQIYVNGQFIGGLDVLKQMYENGTLLQTICPKINE